MKKNIICGFLLISGSLAAQEQTAGYTEIAKWPQGKKAAVSITYDDGTVNQFHKALPIMEELGMRGTFYINTGEIAGSTFQAQFIGRNHEDIIAETETITTNEDNLFERASLIRFLDIPDAVSFHDRAGAAFEQGNNDQAFQLIDEGYALAREIRGIELHPPKIIDGPMIDWDEIKKYADRGHEFGVHTISHPRLAVLDEMNLLYELEKNKEEIEHKLGVDHLFSAECPFGTEDERVMEYALSMFPALRNRMPEEYLEEINRSGKFDPSIDYEKAYVQWQRGPLSKTSLESMKSYIDDIVTRDDTWLVLVFHGIEGIGWEAIPEQTIRSYFEYIAAQEEVWTAPFRDVTKYMRQRMGTEVEPTLSEDALNLKFISELDPAWYNQPLYMKTYVPTEWESVNLMYGDESEPLTIETDEKGKFVKYVLKTPTDSLSLSRF